MDDIEIAGIEVEPFEVAKVKVRTSGWSAPPTFDGSKSVFQWEERFKRWSHMIRFAAGGHSKWSYNSPWRRVDFQVKMELELAKRAIQALAPNVIHEVDSKHNGINLSEVANQFASQAEEYLKAANLYIAAVNSLKDNKDEQKEDTLQTAKMTAMTALKERHEWWLNVKWPADTVVELVVEVYNIRSTNYHLERMKNDWPYLGREQVYCEAKLLLGKGGISERDLFYSLLRILPPHYSPSTRLTVVNLDLLLEFCRKMDACESLRLKKIMSSVPFVQKSSKASDSGKEPGNKSKPASSTKRAKCFYCNIRGHLKMDCQKLKADLEGERPKIVEKKFHSQSSTNLQGVQGIWSNSKQGYAR